MYFIFIIYNYLSYIYMFIYECIYLFQDIKLVFYPLFMDLIIYILYMLC